MKRFRLIENVFNVIVRAKRIKADEEKRKKSVMFAVTSIIYSLLMIAFAFGGVYLLTLQDMGMLALIYIFIVIVAFGLLVGAVIEFLGALLRVIAQFTLNRSPMSWIALAVFLISTGVTIFIAFHFLA